MNICFDENEVDIIYSALDQVFDTTAMDDDMREEYGYILDKINSIRIQNNG